MANSNRDWDRGKERWSDDRDYDWGADNSGYDYGYDAGYDYTREEDYHREGKRRKFNNGNYESYEGGGHGPKKRQIASEPSPHVIFLGLDPDFSESDLQTWLSTQGCNIESVTIIRDRSTGVSKGFGFAQFASTEHARAFVDPLFPYVHVPPPASHGASATAAFNKAMDAGLPHNGRRAKIDYSQSAAPHDRSGAQGRTNANDGTRDIGTSQSSVLLFRGLDPLSGVQAIQQAIKMSSGPGVDGGRSMKRIVLIKDKVTSASFGFAFVEFVDVQAASVVLGATMSQTLHPTGFRISDKPVAASFASPYSFQLVDNPLSYEGARISSSTALGGSEGSWARYWDESATVALLEFEVKEKPKVGSGSKDKRVAKKTKDASNALPTASVIPLSGKPVVLSLSRAAATNASAAAESTLPAAFATAEQHAGDTPEDSPAPSSVKAVTGKKVAPLAASKKTASNINKWNHAQEQLTTIEQRIAPSGEATSGPRPTASVQPAVALEATQPTASQQKTDFSDMTDMSCLLCSRQFKSVEQLERHTQESALHKKNLTDTNLRELAYQKLSARKNPANPKNQQASKYRDRASERRVLFNQPDLPLPEASSAKEKVRYADRPPTPPPAPSPPPNPANDESNPGGKLLKLMGWKAGTGLGASGDGRVDPIETSIYAPGAGLGAGKPKELTSYSDSYLSMTQDSARSRFQNT